MSLPLPLAFRDPDAQPLAPAVKKPLPQTKEQIADEVLRAFEQDVEIVDGSEYTADVSTLWDDPNFVLSMAPLIEAHEAVMPEAPLTETEKWRKAFADPKTGLSFQARIAAENLRGHLK